MTKINELLFNNEIICMPLPPFTELPEHVGSSKTIIIK